MYRIQARVLVLLLALASFTAPAQAQSKNAVTVALEAQKVTQEKGREVLVSALEAKPGEVIEYRATYTNRGTEPVREVWATLPIPAGLEFMPPSAAPAKLLASLDGKAYAPTPLMRREQTPAGIEVLREVPASEYRFLRWSLGTMPAKQSRTVSARARVAPVAVAAAIR